MNLKVIFICLLTIHIACGFTSLLAAFGAMMSAKGEPRHRLFGKIFISAMTGVFITATPLALIIKNLFLFLIGIFSYYLALSGWRYAKNRRGIPVKFDWAISFTMLFASLIMIGMGAYHFKADDYKTIVLLVFGAIGCNLSIADLKTCYNHSATGNQRIVKHFSGMLGATIAALTAFSVTNIPFRPQIILWLGPTVLLVPVIFWWKHRVLGSKRFFQDKQA